MLRPLLKLLRVLNSETRPAQISLAVCFAMVAGLTPLASLHNLLVLLLVLVVRVNLSAFLLGLALFSGLGYVLDPSFHTLGLALLQAPALHETWTALYNTTLARLEHFNNTVVMGSLAVALAAFLPLFLVGNVLIRRYREHLLAWVRKTRLVQALKATKLYQTYRAVSVLRGDVG
jgi:uncharacterized protein (TIGR03546 family)